MIVILLTVALVGLIMAGMAVGVVLKGRRLKGSCGGFGSEQCECAAAGVDPLVAPCRRQQGDSA